MGQLRTVGSLLLVGLLVAAPAFAGRSVTPVEIGNTPQYTINLATGTVTKGITADCRLGNPNDPAYYINGWLMGDESYEFLYHPQQTDACACPYGSVITNVHIFLYYPPGAETCPPLTISGGMADTFWEPTLQCWVPGDELCRTIDYSLTVPNPGLYDVWMPLACSCAVMDAWYMITIHFGTLWCPVMPAIVTDAGPIRPCTNWNNWGQGWQDLQNYGWGYNLAFYADATCCSDPVSTEPQTWGSVKSLYR